MPAFRSLAAAEPRCVRIGTAVAHCFEALKVRHRPVKNTTAKRGLDSICTSDTKDHLADPRERADRATQRLAGKLALRGKVEGFTAFSTWAVYCDDPVTVFRGTSKAYDSAPVEAVLLVPCRKCAKCLQFRQMKWRERALVECARSPRTWFVTLTFSPVHMAGVLAEASMLGGTSDRLIERAAFRHVQRYFKRLRKRGVAFRYLAVYERGEKTGRSHYHLLLHNTGDRPILKVLLEDNWRSFIHARLVASDAGGAASYVTKYATKSFDIRPRASVNYGKAK